MSETKLGNKINIYFHARDAPDKIFVYTARRLKLLLSFLVVIRQVSHVLCSEQTEVTFVNNLHIFK